MTLYAIRDRQIEAMRRTVYPRPTRLDRLLRRAKPLPSSPVVGTIWRWDHADMLTQAEADYWKYNTLPWGWSILTWS